MKKFVKIALLLVLSLSVLSGCKDATANISDASTALFTIGKTKVTKGYLYAKMTTDDAANTIISKILGMIATDEVETTDEIRKSAEDLYTNYKEQIEKNKQDFEETIKSYGYASLDEFMDFCVESAKTTALVDKYIDENWEDILKEYAPVKARIISISAASDLDAAKKKAAEVFDKINAGEDFATIAEEYSETKEYAKETLYTNKSSIDQSIKDFFKTVNAPKISETITSQNEKTLYIVQVTNINAEQLKSDFVDYLKNNTDFSNTVYSYFCKKHNVKFYDIDVYNLIKNNYPAFLVQD
ncbi:MAG: peptidylprolyl isomerase [Erysipelotrichaceae bacterium]|nr:peptidylprolyl isomerase [Erysipelotrichaceae bacterium]